MPRNKPGSGAARRQKPEPAPTSAPSETARPAIAVRPADPARAAELDAGDAPAKPIGSGAKVQPYIDERKLRRLQEDNPPGQPLTVRRAVKGSPKASHAIEPAAAAIDPVELVADLATPVRQAGADLGDDLNALIENAYLALRESGRGTVEAIRVEAERVGQDVLTLALIEAEIALAVGDDDASQTRRQRLERLRETAESALVARLRTLRAAAPFALHMQTRRALVAVADTALGAARLILAAKVGYPVPVLPPPLVLD